MVAREWLHSKVNPFVPLQIMVAVEALRTLITLKRTIMRGLLLRGICPWLAVHSLWICGITTVERHGQHIGLHVTQHRHLGARAMHI
jgi:hypothetical protein